LREAAKRYSGSESGLDAWYRIAKSAEWRSLQDVRKTYASAYGVNVGSKTYTVFNIAGNKLRLLTSIVYRYQTIYVKHVLTHAEYDKGAWKK
jgi:mRNA interferase HigB